MTRSTKNGEGFSTFDPLDDAMMSHSNASVAGSSTASSGWFSTMPMWRPRSCDCHRRPGAALIDEGLTDVDDQRCQRRLKTDPLPTVEN
ncbi:hypothetical protein [Brevibacterium senegalense]|uniref:hypothetical protein n=1 Tax=Brevibacterium senegalense TaxID=1033736 RepID=UPI0002D749BE|nr:hypothetical protein [Brevibacterium senegalense]